MACGGAACGAVACAMCSAAAVAFVSAPCADCGDCVAIVPEVTLAGGLAALFFLVLPMVSLQALAGYALCSTIIIVAEGTY